MTDRAETPDSAVQLRKLAILVVGLAALIVTMLVAFALPAIHSGPHQVPIGVVGPASSTTAVRQALPADQWDVTTYDSEKALTSAINNRDVMAGMVLRTGHVTGYTATAAGLQVAAAFTGVVSTLAEHDQAALVIKDLKPFPSDDPKGAGFSSVALPMVFGGMFPATLLSSMFPGHPGLRLRVFGGIAFSLLAGFSATALLQYGTNSLSGSYWFNSLAMSLGVAALVLTLLGLQSHFGLIGIALGAAMAMFLGNPLSGIASGPHWLPDGWATLGQLLPTGASGGLLRATAFFGGTGALVPALTLACWTVFGYGLNVVAHRRGPRRAAPTEATSQA